MDYALAAVFGLSVGAVLQLSSIPRSRWLEQIAAVALYLIGLSSTIWFLHSSFWVSYTLSGAIIIGLILAAGLGWKDHPLLAGTGYWYRVWNGLRHGAMLRRSYAALPVREADSANQPASPDHVR
jgi:hypothetical protein